MYRFFVLLAVVVLWGCQGDLGPTDPSSTDGAKKKTQVWLTPAPQGDMLRLAREPELSRRGLANVDVFSFYLLAAYSAPGWECGAVCGPNTYQTLLDVVPGGMFKWLTDQGAQLAFEVGSVKPYACTEEAIMEHQVKPTIVAMQNIAATGTRVSYLAQDSPFAAGVGNNDQNQDRMVCHISLEETVRLIGVYIDGVHQYDPDVQIGVITQYPFFSVDDTMTHLLAMERAGVPIPYLHLDFDIGRVTRDQCNAAADLPRLAAFCRERNIQFGVINFGGDGSSNEKYAADAWASQRVSFSAVGVTDHTVFQSWAEDPPCDLNGRRHKPDLVPDSDPFTHLGLILGMLDYMGAESLR